MLVFTTGTRPTRRFHERESKVNISQSRRNVLKMGVSTCALSGVGLSTLFTSRAEATALKSLEFDSFYYTACSNNCGSACVLKAYVKDDKVVRIETDNSIEDNWDEGLLQVRACPRGRSMRLICYSSERLKYPMKRVGKRGEEKFERITWDEA